jgi:two-component system sensor histidine kinase GlrK
MARLAEINGLLKGAGQHWIDIRNSAQLAELETSRLWLGSQIALALTGAAFVILAVGWWLVRPLQNLERAIERLGEKRFDQPVVVGGPVDFRQIGGQLDRLRQRLAGLEADRERSLRHVSHELKTPLTALREGVALLQDEIPGPLGSAQREIVAILRNNVMALQRQIEGLLSLNAASFGSGRIIRRPIDIRGLLADTVRDRQLHTQARQLTLEIDAPARQVSVDPEKLAVIVDNLLSNAIDFSPDGGEIRLLARVSDGMLHLECIDQGPGVAEEDHERIFEPFVQGRRKSMVPRHGSGVGLSIVRELASAMGGRVGILAGDGGAHFFVDIPDGKQRQSGL